MNKWRIAITWSVVIVLVSSLYNEMLIVLESESIWLALVGLVIFSLGLYLAMKRYRDKSQGGYASFGNIYQFGILMSLPMLPLIIAHRFISNAIHTQYLQAIIDAKKAALITQGVTESQMEMGMRISAFFGSNPVGIVIASILGTVLTVVLLGLIPAGILNKPRPFMMEDEDNNIPQA